LTYRGQLLDVEINQNATTYSLRDGEQMIIQHRDEEITLTRTNASVVRTTLEPLKQVS
jgi:hypothetical protein